jgi:hypothetical protein
MIGALVTLALSVAFTSLGRWGRRNAPTLVPTTYSPECRAKDMRSLRRGAATCLFAGALFAVLGLVLFADVLTSGRTTR